MSGRKLILLFVITLLSFIKMFAQNTLIKTSSDDLYRKGIELLDKQKFGAAREMFQQYIQQNRNDIKSIDAEYYIAYAALNLFNSDAETLINNFVTKYPYHSKASNANFDLGCYYYNDKQYDKAIEYFSKINQAQLSEEQRVEAKFKLGYSYFTKKDFPAAVQSFNEIKNYNNKYTFAASYYAGYAEFKNGEYDAALVDFKKTEENEDFKTLVPHMIANVYYRKGNYDEVIKYSESVLSNPNVQIKNEILLMLADAYYNKKDYNKALENFNKYLKEENGQLTKEIQYRMAYSQFKINNYEEAINNFKSIASSQDTLGQSSSYYLGLSYLQTNTKEFALTAFDQARKADYNRKTKEEALFYFGKVNYDLLRFHDAIAPLKEFVRSYPQSIHDEEANELLSEAFLKTNNYSEAISHIESLPRRSMRINTAYQRITYYKASEYFNNNQYAEAIQMFDKSLQFTFDKDVFLASNFWKGEVFSINKDYERAINSYSIVFQKSSDADNEYYLKSRYGIGYAYYNTKQYSKALPHFKEYVSKLEKASNKENYYDAILRLADLYYVDKKYSEAIKYYNIAIDNKVPDIDYAYYQKGLVLVYEDRLAEAKKSFETVINKYPNSLQYEGALYQNAQIDFRNGNLESAANGFSMIINSKLNNQPYEANALLKRAIIYNTQKKHEEALKDYNLILEKYYNHPIHEDALRGAQETYALLDRSEDFNNKLDEFKQKNPESAVLEDVGFESAKSLFYEEKYKKSISGFENYLVKYPQSANSFDGRFFLAESYYQTSDKESAARNFVKVIDEGKSTFINKALQRMAEISYSNQKYEDSKKYFLLYYSNAKNKKEKSNALLGLIDAYYILAKYDSVTYYCNEVLTSGNVNINAETKANMYLGKSAYAQGQYEKATDYFLNLINYNNESVAAEAQYLISEIQYKQKKYKQSIESLYYLNNHFSQYDYWLGKSFLLISDNLIALNEIFQAKSTLKSVIDNSKNIEVKEAAKAKLAEIENKAKEGGSDGQ